MDVKFFNSLYDFNSLYEGDSPNGVKLGMVLTGGDFWPRQQGCHTVYRGQDGNMDYDTIQAVMAVDAAEVSIANQNLPADTIWHYLRRQVSDCGRESADSPACVVVIDENGDMVGQTPNPPVSLSIAGLSGGRFQLRWRYSKISQQIAPTGFHIYLDSGSGFDFDTPHATVAYSKTYEYSWTSGSLTHGQRYRFVVRSYRQGAGEDQNQRIVSAVADAQGPAAITGLRTSWQEV